MPTVKNSARMVFAGKEHKDIFFQGKYHKAMYVGNNLVWERLGDALHFKTKVIGYLKSFYTPCAVKDKAVFINYYVTNGDDKASFDMYHFQNGEGLGEKTWSVIKDGGFGVAWQGHYFAKIDPYILFYRQHGNSSYGEFYYTYDGDEFEYNEGGAANFVNFSPAFSGTPNEGAAVNNGILLIPRNTYVNMSTSMNYWCPYQTAKIKEDGSLYDFQQNAYYLVDETYAYLRFFTDPVTGITYAQKVNYKYQSGTFQSIIPITTSTSDYKGRTLVNIVENGYIYTSYFGSNYIRTFSAMKAYNNKIFLRQTAPSKVNVVLDVATRRFTEISSKVSVSNLYFIHDHYISIGSKAICESVDGINWSIQENSDIPRTNYDSCYVEDDGIYICGGNEEDTEFKFKVTYVKVEY